MTTQQPSSTPEASAGAADIPNPLAKMQDGWAEIGGLGEKALSVKGAGISEMFGGMLAKAAHQKAANVGIAPEVLDARMGQVQQAANGAFGR